MSYKLKPGVESFEVVDGAFAGKKFLRGNVYEKIPSEERSKFEKVKEQDRLRSEVGGRRQKILPQTSSEALLKPNTTDGQGGDK